MARVRIQPQQMQSAYGELGNFADFSNSSNVEIIVGTGCSLSTDTTVTYRGQPTTKLTVAAGAAANLDIGISTASLVLTDEHAKGNGNGPLIIYKSDLATTGFDLFIGNDNTYSPNVKLGASQNYTDYEGFIHVTGRGVDAGVVTTTGSIGLRGTKIWKLRFKRSGTGAGSIWFANCSIAPRTRPQVIVSLDDAWSEHYTYVYDAAKTRGIPISFSLRMDTLGTTNYATAAQMFEIANDSSGLFELINHANTGTNRTTLGDTAYTDKVKECRDYLVGNGMDETAAHVHVWVQGDFSDAAIDTLLADGFLCGREVGSANRSWLPHHIARDATKRSWFKHPAGCKLDDTTTLSTVKTYINTAIARGSVFWIMGHKFQASQGTDQWINSSNASYGFTALLDHLVYLRESGQADIVKASDWYKQFAAGDRPVAIRVAA